MDRIHTGSPLLDLALAGGIPAGSALLVAGEEGAGATEFALTVLRAAVGGDEKRKARFASALRSAARVQQEVGALFGGPTANLEVRVLNPEDLAEGSSAALAGLDRGDVLAIESADSLSPPGGPRGLPPFWHELADAAQARGVTVVLLHSPGTLPSSIEAALAEEADGVLRFEWHDGGQTRRRVLSIPKLRGLAPLLDGEQVPVFEVSLMRGVGFSVSREKSVL